MKIKNAIRATCAQFCQKRYLHAMQEDLQGIHARGKQAVILWATPTYNNLGDQAIAFAQRAFLKRVLPLCEIVEVPLWKDEQQFADDIQSISPLVERRDLCVLLGGGNMGTRYMREEACKRLVVQAFPQNRIVLFPQTIDFGNTSEDQKELGHSQMVYAAHPDLHMFARERASYHAMKTVFPTVDVGLVPDIVLSLQQSRPEVVRKGVCFCLRSDEESALSAAQKATILKAGRACFSQSWATDTWDRYSMWKDRYAATPSRREERLQKKWEEFRKAQLVITDRLHGLVFSAITETPCIALPSSNHKVTATFEWLQDVPGLWFCRGPEEVFTRIREFQQSGYTSCAYASSKFQALFQPLANVCR